MKPSRLDTLDDADATDNSCLFAGDEVLGLTRVVLEATVGVEVSWTTTAKTHAGPRFHLRTTNELLGSSEAYAPLLERAVHRPAWFSPRRGCRAVGE